MPPATTKPAPLVPAAIAPGKRGAGWSSDCCIEAFSLLLLSVLYRMVGAVAMHEVVWRPGPGKLHPALLQLLRGRRVFVLVAFDRLVVDQVRDVQQHLARLHPLAGNLLRQREEHTMHLDGQGTRLGLALPLPAGSLPQAGQVLLPNRHITGRVAGARIVHQHLQVHLCLAAQTLDIGQEVTLVGSDRTAQRVIILKRGTKTKRKYGVVLEAVSDNAGMVLGRLLAGL